MSAITIAALLLAATTGAQGDAPLSPHDVEIRGFATTLAIAKTVAAACAGAHINLASIEELRTRLHMVAADRPAFVEAGRQAVDALREGIEHAPSRQAWCHATFRLYGPDGTMIRGLISR